MSYNKAILIGRLGSDPELRKTASGIPVASFSIAVTRDFNKDISDWITIVAWRERAEFVSRYFSKGKPILVEGSIQTRQYTDKNNQKRTAVEVVAENVRFVESKKDGDRPRTADIDGYASPAYSAASGADDFAEIEDDGDMPF